MIASLYLDVFCDSSNVINWQYALFTDTKMHVAATEGIGGGRLQARTPVVYFYVLDGSKTSKTSLKCRERTSIRKNKKISYH